MGLPLPAVQAIARQLLMGLEHLHKKKLAHRNVKPDNIMLDKPFVSIAEVRGWWVKGGGVCQLWGRGTRDRGRRGRGGGHVSIEIPRT